MFFLSFLCIFLVYYILQKKNRPDMEVLWVGWQWQVLCRWESPLTAGDVIGFIKGGMVAFTSACRHQADTLDYDGRVL